MTKSSICCVDASVVVRLLIGRDDRPVRALWDSLLEERVEIIAPVLLLYEVTNALYQQQRQNRLGADIVSLMIKTARAMPIRFYNSEDLHADAHRIASELGLSAAYDAHYLVTAGRNDADFWTSDKKLVDKIAGKLEWVHYLQRDEQLAGKG